MPTAGAAEVLPPGVGRVPQWWMDITPHYTLDEEDQEERRREEDRMAFYCMQLEAAHEAGVLNSDGTPKLGPDLKPMSWTPLTPWNQREGNNNAGADSGASGPGGRNFKPGQPLIDPSMFGIEPTDPDYQAYLTGAKLPPGYFELMGRMMATAENGGTTEGILNNLRQTEYGRYGHQAENPRFKPAWIKKKLRSTDVGANIRQGQYNDSPNKHVRARRVDPEDVPNIPPAPLQAAPLAPPPPPPPPPPQQEDDDHEELLRRQQEKLLKLQQLQRQLQQQKEAEERQALAQAKLQQQQQHKGHQASFQLENPFDKVQVQQQQQQQQRQQHTAPAPQQHYHHHEQHYEEDEVIEEIIDDDEEFTEDSYEEEVIEDDGELGDLQAILAAKQAELQRLQAQY